jgi:hypothetical protein
LTLIDEKDQVSGSDDDIRQTVAVEIEGFHGLIPIGTRGHAAPSHERIAPARGVLGCITAEAGVAWLVRSVRENAALDQTLWDGLADPVLAGSTDACGSVGQVRP